LTAALKVAMKVVWKVVKSADKRVAVKAVKKDCCLVVMRVV